MSTDNNKLNSVTRKGRKKNTASEEQLKTEFEKELEQGLIKKQTFKGVVTYFNSKGERVNANGEPVTKSGLPDKRKGNGHKHWKEVAAKNKSNKEVIKTAVVETDSDSDVEFEIEIDDTVKQQPVVQPPPQPVVDNKYEQLIKEQEEIRKKYDEQLKKAKEENDKLKSGLVFNDHLSRISHMARNTKLKF